MKQKSGIFPVKKICGFIQLTRPELSFAAGICVIVGQVLAADGFASFQESLLGFLCGFFVSGAALVLNDYFDYETDLINAPDRAIASGVVSKKEALGLTVFISISGLSCAAVLGWDVLLISIILWITGILYNSKFKRTGLAGNLLVSFSVGLTFVFGAFSVGEPWNRLVWVFSLIAFFIDLGEEIAGDAMDIEGDQVIRSQSIAIKKGRPFAVRITLICWVTAIMIGFAPIVLGWMGLLYIITICIITSFLTIFGVQLFRAKTIKDGKRAMRGAYLGATLGLILLLIGTFIL